MEWTHSSHFASLAKWRDIRYKIFWRHVLLLWPALMLATLTACSGSSDESSTLPTTLTIKADVPIYGVQLNIQHKTDASVNLQQINFLSVKSGLGTAAKLLTRPIPSLTNSQYLGYDIALYVLEGQGSMVVKMFSLTTKNVDDYLISRIRCADRMGNIISCSMNWE